MTLEVAEDYKWMKTEALKDLTFENKKAFTGYLVMPCQSIWKDGYALKLLDILIDPINFFQIYLKN